MTTFPLSHIVLALACGSVLGACAPGTPLAPASQATPIIDTKPEITIPLGSRVDDVVTLLGHPTKGPRVDTYSELIQYTYIFPFPAVSGETKLSQGRIRTEVGDRVYMFFDRGGVLRKMGLHTDPYYPSFIAIPADRITVAARALDAEGRQIPLVPGMVIAPPPQPAGETSQPTSQGG